MSLFTYLRAVAWLKRIALALEYGNRIARERMALELPEVRRRERGPAKMAEINRPTPADWNARYEEDHSA